MENTTYNVAIKKKEKKEVSDSKENGQYYKRILEFME